MTDQKKSKLSNVELGIIAIAAIIILAAGYNIYASNKDTPPSKTTNVSSEDQDISATTDWAEAKSPGGFSIKIPNGWNVTNYATAGDVAGQIVGTDLVYDASVKATVENLTTPLKSANDQYDLGASFNTFLLNKKFEYSPKDAGSAKVESKSVTRGGLTGTLTTVQYGQQSQELENQTYYVYTFPLPGDRILVASYVHNADQTDQRQHFEYAVRTIQVTE